MTSIGTREDKRRSLESQRSLSLIYPINKYKRSNQIVMKLLSDLPSLSVLCLKEHKFAEANQLYQAYSSSTSNSNSSGDVVVVQNSFELRQIKYHAAYEHCLSELRRLGEKQASLSTRTMMSPSSSSSGNHDSSLIEESLLSLDIAKVLEPILDIERDENLIQAIVLSDVVAASNFNLGLSLALIDHCKSKLNLLNSTTANTSQNAEGNTSENYVEIEELKGKILFI